MSTISDVATRLENDVSPSGGMTDVVVVGYGPSGVSASNFLGAYGLKTLVLERDGGIYPRARAVTVNDWTLRCFQSVGLDEALLRNMDRTAAIRWRTYAGKELFRTVFKENVSGHPTSANIYQPVMEQTLREGAARYAEHVTVRFGQDVTAIAQDSDGASVSFRDLETGVTQTIRARYVLACDGGSSTVRTKLGITLVGSTLDTKWVVIDARVKRWWPDRHILTMWSDQKRPVVDIALALGNHRWEFPLAPHESEADFSTEAHLWPLLQAMGVTNDDVEIRQHAFYRHHVRHAERWREGRVFLVGDAAHLMPPWAGQGMQSGVRDAFNITWKLREVLAGRLPESLLDTYEPERAPNVAAITRFSERLGRIITMQMSRKEKALGVVGGIAMKLGLPMPPSPTSDPRLERGWIRGTAEPKSAVGRLLPHVRIASSDGRYGRLDDVLGTGFALLGAGLDPRTLLSEAERARWDALGARYMAVRPVTEMTHGDDVVDVDGTLLAWLRKFRANAVALRPDRFVAAASGPRDRGLDVPDFHPEETTSPR